MSRFRRSDELAIPNVNSNVVRCTLRAPEEQVAWLCLANRNLCPGIFLLGGYPADVNAFVGVNILREA